MPLLSDFSTEILRLILKINPEDTSPPAERTGFPAEVKIELSLLR
ncbi:hypothetical protein BVRB_4g076870 [Beta vulgaris subsp. vulgaris]|nr:hypothetical protein BVRB_4g076870 [Beta vulgaris subsp. vulgaris]